jgi:RimJ/RimL family protein N-acetyltransferase
VIAPPPPLAPLADEAIVLRGFLDGDVDDLVDALQDPEIPRWTNVPAPYRRGDALRFLGGGAEERGERTLAIRDATDERLLGAIGLRIDPRHDVGDIGYWVASEARGRGVATRAIRLVSRWGLEELGLVRMQILAEPANTGWRRAAERAGYRAEGTLRAFHKLKGRSVDLVMHAFVRGDPVPP